MNHISDADLQAFLDSELSDARHRHVVNHLNGCSACEVRLASFQELFAGIGSVEETPLRADLLTGIMARISPKRAISPRARWILVTELALGVGSLIAATGWDNLAATTWVFDLAGSPQLGINPGDLALWLQSLATPVEMGLSAIGALGASATGLLASVLPVTGWAVLLAALLVTGLAANGLILTRTGQARRDDRRSA